MRINTNVSALNTQRVLGKTNAAVAKQIGRLSSGFRINSASDDAAGLGIANKLRTDVRSLQQARATPSRRRRCCRSRRAPRPRSATSWTG